MRGSKVLAKYAKECGKKETTENLRKYEHSDKLVGQRIVRPRVSFSKLAELKRSNDLCKVLMLLLLHFIATSHCGTGCVTVLMRLAECRLSDSTSILVLKLYLIVSVSIAI